MKSYIDKKIGDCVSGNHDSGNLISENHITGNLESENNPRVLKFLVYSL